MDFSIANGLYDPLSALKQARGARVVRPVDNPGGQDAPAGTNLPVVVNDNARPKNSGARLLSETSEELGDGTFRRTQTFQNANGRQFTRIEDYALTDGGARRAVTQQNPSGSITLYEEILDRQDGGNFRRTQRFRDGAGDVATTITPDYTVSDPFILTGGGTARAFGYAAPFQPLRGTQLDMRA